MRYGATNLSCKTIDIFIDNFPCHYFPILIPQSAVGITWFHPVMSYNKDSAIIFIISRRTLTLLGNGMSANDCKRSLDQQFNMPSEAWKSSR
jgi:hypothetical protein